MNAKWNIFPKRGNFFFPHLFSKQQQEQEHASVASNLHRCGNCQKRRKHDSCFVCQECHVCLCATCFLRYHKNHPYQELTDYIEETRRTLISMIEAIEDGLPALDEVIQATKERTERRDSATNTLDMWTAQRSSLAVRIREASLSLDQQMSLNQLRVISRDVGALKQWNDIIEHEIQYNPPDYRLKRLKPSTGIKTARFDRQILKTIFANLSIFDRTKLLPVCKQWYSILIEMKGIKDLVSINMMKIKEDLGIDNNSAGMDRCCSVMVRLAHYSSSRLVKLVLHFWDRINMTDSLLGTIGNSGTNIIWLELVTCHRQTQSDIMKHLIRPLHYFACSLETLVLNIWRPSFEERVPVQASFETRVTECIAGCQHLHTLYTCGFGIIDRHELNRLFDALPKLRKFGGLSHNHTPYDLQSFKSLSDLTTLAIELHQFLWHNTWIKALSQSCPQLSALAIFCVCGPLCGIERGDVAAILLSFSQLQRLCLVRLSPDQDEISSAFEQRQRLINAPVSLLSINSRSPTRATFELMHGCRLIRIQSGTPQCRRLFRQFFWGLGVFSHTYDL